MLLDLVGYWACSFVDLRADAVTDAKLMGIGALAAEVEALVSEQTNAHNVGLFRDKVALKNSDWHWW